MNKSLLIAFVIVAIVATLCQPSQAQNDVQLGQSKSQQVEVHLGNREKRSNPDDTTLAPKKKSKKKSKKHKKLASTTEPIGTTEASTSDEPANSADESTAEGLKVRPLKSKKRGRFYLLDLEDGSHVIIPPKLNKVLED